MNNHNPFNPQWYGYSPATNQQSFSGSAPYVYNYLPHDNKSCIVAKSLYNQTHSNIYTPDSIVRTIPGSALIQGSILNKTEELIKQNCTPSFNYDSASKYTQNQFANNYGTNNFGSNKFG